MVPAAALRLRMRWAIAQGFQGGLVVRHEPPQAEEPISGREPPELRDRWGEARGRHWPTLPAVPTSCRCASARVLLGHPAHCKRLLVVLKDIISNVRNSDVEIAVNIDTGLRNSFAE